MKKSKFEVHYTLSGFAVVEAFSEQGAAEVISETDPTFMESAISKVENVVSNGCDDGIYVKQVYKPSK